MRITLKQIIDLMDNTMDLAVYLCDSYGNRFMDEPIFSNRVYDYTFENWESFIKHYGDYTIKSFNCENAYELCVNIYLDGGDQ